MVLLPATYLVGKRAAFKWNLHFYSKLFLTLPLGEGVASGKL